MSRSASGSGGVGEGDEDTERLQQPPMQETDATMQQQPTPQQLQTCSQDPRLSLDERLKLLYPMVNEAETPLPRCWSVKDKFNYIGLSHNNLRVQYKGNGKTHKEASSVRATHAIPASCGIYYFEVRDEK